MWITGRPESTLSLPHLSLARAEYGERSLPLTVTFTRPPFTSSSASHFTPGLQNEARHAVAAPCCAATRPYAATHSISGGICLQCDRFRHQQKEIKLQNSPQLFSTSWRADETASLLHIMEMSSFWWGPFCWHLFLCSSSQNVFFMFKAFEKAIFHKTFTNEIKENHLYVTLPRRDALLYLGLLKYKPPCDWL